MNATLATRVRDAYLEACEVELWARKPGNVSIYSPGHRMTAADFRLSARVSAAPLANPGVSLGPRIYRAVMGTNRAVRCNTNLGIVLLCAPMMQAALMGTGRSLRADVGSIVESAGRIDTAWVYCAIRLASPAGLGMVVHNDVRKEPACSLREAMWPAAQRDRIAYQYISVYKDVFEWAVPRLRDLRRRWGDESWAAVGVFLGLLAQIPDTHIVRKHGYPLAIRVSEQAARMGDMLCSTDTPIRHLSGLEEWDRELKCAGINPGTTADLTVATLLAVRLEEIVDARPWVNVGPAALCGVVGPSTGGIRLRNQRHKEYRNGSH